MLRFAASFICDDGVKLDATVHDAVLIEASVGDIQTEIARSRQAMDRASELVLYGFKLRTESEVISWPERYRDKRGAGFFDELISRLSERLRSYRPWEEIPYYLSRTSYQPW